MLIVGCCAIGFPVGSATAVDGVVVDVSEVEASAEVTFDTSQSGFATVEWPAGNGARGIAKFRLFADKPLIESMSLATAKNATPRVIARDIEPFTAITVGTRNLDTPGGWTIFFDKVHQRPYQRHYAQLSLETARAKAHGSRGSIAFGRLAAGAFSGELVFSFFGGSPLILAEAVVSTSEDRRAMIYDAGLVAVPGTVQRFAWSDYDDALKSLDATPSVSPGPRALRFRTVAAEMPEGGTVAVFPPPHRFFYPLDFADNFGFNWFGRDYASAPKGDGWGIRQPPEGDGRFVPWVNAPPKSMQRFGAFYLLSTEGATAALAAAQRYTHSDRYVPLPGYKTFTSHYHIEHALDVLKRQSLASSQEIPTDLISPGFVRVFRNTGIDIVHLAEFHNGETPKLPAAQRLRQLRTLHAECQRLSDDSFCLLPGEEPNVHLGGHWISFFPRPVLWVLNRPPGTPFEERLADGETVYHVGSPEDVLQLMQREQGLMWTAHARIKSSVAFPDGYRDKAFFNSPHFLGAAWKAMPADYSRDTLGWRVLDLLDEMNNWGQPKQVLGEVDVFKVQPGYEFYGHANVNYVRLDRLPRFTEGWSDLLAALRAGRFFTTTGEVLITEFKVQPALGKVPNLRAHLQWTFPLDRAEIVGGDGSKVFRHRIDLSDTKEHGQLDLSLVPPADFASCRWLRLEVWDIATNGAFAQPVWLSDG